MINIELVRKKPEKVRENLERRKEDRLLNLFDSLKEKDDKWRNLKKKVDEMRHDKNKYSEKVNELMKEGEKEKAQKFIKKSKKVDDELEAAEKKMEEVKDERDEILKKIPNMMHESVPYGEDDSDNQTVRKWGDPKEKKDWMKPHGEVAEDLGCADFERSAKIAGHGFYYLYGDLARLNQALIQFALDKVQEKGYTYVETPLMMRREHYEGVTDLDAFDDVLYKIEDEDLHMIATSEHPLMAQFADEVLQRKELPVKHSSYSMCFRKEVGTHNIDEKGLFRTHQFNKVEMAVFCKPENSWDWHEELIKVAEEVHKELELPYQVVNVCTGDLGQIASKKYDLEVWSPRQEEYNEVVSCSNCTDYQSRRLNIKYEDESGGHSLIHTLNSTAVATSRTMVGILENYQNKDGSVTIPEALRPYMGGQEKITPT